MLHEYYMTDFHNEEMEVKLFHLMNKLFPILLNDLDANHLSFSGCENQISFQRDIFYSKESEYIKITQIILYSKEGFTHTDLSVGIFKHSEDENTINKLDMISYDKLSESDNYPKKVVNECYLYDGECKKFVYIPKYIMCGFGIYWLEILTSLREKDIWEYSKNYE